MIIPELKVGPFSYVYLHLVEDVPGRDDLKFVRWGSSPTGGTKNPRLGVMIYNQERTRWHLEGAIRKRGGRYQVRTWNPRAELEFSAVSEALAEQLLRAIVPTYVDICNN
jgi:hypothetical protein